MKCKCCELTRSSGIRSHHAHAEGCPNLLPRVNTPCAICGELYHPNGTYPTYCQDCFEKWSG